ncbi:hypothetical protein LZ30DRAFT_812170, partial [Colletotrichum cereale]
VDHRPLDVALGSERERPAFLSEHEDIIPQVLRSKSAGAYGTGIDAIFVLESIYDAVKRSRLL